MNSGFSVTSLRSCESEFQRIREAYIEMVKAGYRPGAPGDGCGHIDPGVPNDAATIAAEATEYAVDFIAEEDAMTFDIGVSKYPNRALVYMVEAARCYCGKKLKVSRRLLKLALSELHEEENLDIPAVIKS